MIVALAIALLAAQPNDPLPFAPPIDQPLRYRQTEHRLDSAGRDLRFTLTEEVGYARDGTGYVMTIRTISADAAAPAGPTAMFEAAMRPFIGVPVRLRLSATGDPAELIDADATWARVVAAMQASAAALPADEPADRRAMIETTAHAFATFPAAERETMMKAPALALLGIDVPDLAVGESAPLDGPVQGPSGAALRSRGTIRRDPDDDGERRFVRDLVTDGTPRLHETDRIAISVSSGLLHVSTGRIAVADPTASGGERLLSEQSLALVP